MELTDIKHITEKDLLEFKPDLFIAASGYESRSICIAGKIEYNDVEKVVLSFNEGLKDLSRPKNDNFYRDKGFIKYQTAGHDEPDFDTIFKSVRGKNKLKVLIDISVMTRVWYHSFLKFLNNFEDCEQLSARVAYCAAIYNEPMTLKKKLMLKSFDYENESNVVGHSEKKTALIMGLGVEKDVSNQVCSLIKPDTTYLLYADPSIQKSYVENVFINNHDLISKIDIKNLKGYALQDTKVIYELLLDIALPLRKDHKIIIVPQGPKIFSLVSMIFQMSYPDVNLMYPQYKVRKVKDRESSGNYTAIDLIFEEEL